MRKLRSIFIFATLIMTFTIVSYADTYDIGTGEVIDINDYSNGDTINVSGVVEVTNSGTAVLDVAIVCEEGTMLTLNNASIENDRYPITFKGSGNTLILKGDNYLTSNGSDSDAIVGYDNCELLITGQGKLNIDSEHNGISSKSGETMDISIISGYYEINTQNAGIYT